MAHMLCSAGMDAAPDQGLAMSEKRTLYLAHAQARATAAELALTSPDGWRVTFQPPKRNGEQNALLWVWLTAFSEQKQWPINGAMQQISPEDWKDLLTAAYRRESTRVAMGLDGGMVMLGLRTSEMDKADFAAFLDFVQSMAAAHGVEPRGTQ